MKKLYFLLLALTMVISGGAVFLVLTRLSPYSDTAWLSITLFFLSTFILCASTIALIGGVLRLMVYRQAMYFYQYIIALRQGILLSLFCVGYLAFSSLGVVTWWNILLLFLAVIFVELLFLNTSVDN